MSATQRSQFYLSSCQADSKVMKIRAKTIETLNLLRKETLDQITLTESHIRSLK